MTASQVIIIGALDPTNKFFSVIFGCLNTLVLTIFFYQQEKTERKLFKENYDYNNYLKNYKNILEENIPLPCFVFCLDLNDKF